ncbi:hypothetical protein DFO66_102343 [Brevibacterium sanguinis]|uniref:DUF5324 family protein n=2 Tax=Brevibacterium TaxID=1696 RepID=A0A366IMT6_9MICO|nr:MULTISPECIES: hypothetical protein [Brevibacterium]RBP67287.1 hypothetical protein DFO66_102343 [Brevibacterium sanguinis]RBP73812.1 hypothetical protein DFO65_102343 [Brevibacterium celere]
MFMSQKSRRGPLASKLDSAKKSSLKVLSDAGDYAAPKLREAADKANHQVEVLTEKARPQVEALTDKANQQVHALADRIEAYRPEATEKAGKVASGAAASLAAMETPQLIDDLAVRLTGDKKAMKKARRALEDASKRIAKQTKQKSSGGRKALVWTLVIGSAAGIGYYMWKKAQPVEDPWSTPLPNNRPADARPVGSTPASRQGTTPQVTQTTVPAGKDDSDPKH